MSDTQPKSRPSYGVWAFNALLFGFIVWGFLHVPHYRVPTWPKGWAPTGEQWKTEWTEIDFSAPGATVTIDQVMPAERSVRLCLNGDWPDGWQWARYDLQARKIVARTPPDLLQVSLSLELGAVVDFEGTGSVLTIQTAEIDPLTLAPRPWTGVFATPPGEHFTLIGFSRIPEGGAALLMLQGDYMKDGGVVWWVRFDAEGREIARRGLLEQNDPVTWLPFPESNPQLFVLKYFWGDEGTPRSIAIRTGDLHEVPPNAHPDAAVIHYRDDAPASHRGYAAVVHWADLLADHTDLQFVFSTPSVLCEIYPPTRDNGERASQQLARVRRAVWNQMYDQQALKLAAIQARRLDQIYLRRVGDDNDPLRPIGGDLPMSVRIAAAQPNPEDPAELPEESVPTRAERIAQVQVPSFVGPEESVVITQFLPHVPESLALPHGLFRLGLLAPDATEVTWLGWLPLSETVPVPGVKPTQLHLARIGDSLLCWLQASDFESYPGPVWYTLIPCPNELMALPEGELQ